MLEEKQQIENHSAVLSVSGNYKILVWLGRALVVLGVAFVLHRFHYYKDQIQFHHLLVYDWVCFFLLIIIFFFSSLLLAFAWRKLLFNFGIKTSYFWALKCYGLSQLAKYVPGNIFHLAGRQAIGMTSGIPAWPLVKSSVWEIGLIAMTGALFGILALSLIIPSIGFLLPVTFFAITCLLAAILLKYFFSLAVSQAFGFYILFLFSSGLIFVFLLSLVEPGDTINYTSWLPICGAYVLAWLAGLVTPGAPAGIGIREMVLILFLGAVVTEAGLLQSVVLCRFVTIIGDLVYFFFSFLLPSISNNCSQAEPSKQ